MRKQGFRRRGVLIALAFLLVPGVIEATNLVVRRNRWKPVATEPTATSEAPRPPISQRPVALVGRGFSRVSAVSRTTCSPDAAAFVSDSRASNAERL